MQALTAHKTASTPRNEQKEKLNLACIRKNMRNITKEMHFEVEVQKE